MFQETEAQRRDEAQMDGAWAWGEALARFELRAAERAAAEAAALRELRREVAGHYNGARLIEPGDTLRSITARKGSRR
jgi:hypothetical protein